MGNVETREDRLTPALAARFAATLDREARSDVAPQGIHWCLCTPEAQTAALGQDGHPAGGGGFLPESPLPRRMWASSDVRFDAPIGVGAIVTRRSEVLEATPKSGSAGPLLFVTVEHKTSADGVLAVEERQTIVYRAPATGPAPAPARALAVADSAPWPWRRSLVPHPPLLFRYSALTFNSHRIHYDLPYAQGEEGYAGLVVHGPLTATLLLDLCDRELGPNRLESFAFRAVSPAFAGDELVLLGRPEGERITLEARAGNGTVVIKAQATIRTGAT